MRNFHQEVLRLIRSGQPMAWATVIRSSGSTPQKPGSGAIFGTRGLLAGTIGGGIMEAEVEKLARTLLKTKTSNLFQFKLDEGEGGQGAICGGEAEVLIDAEPVRHLEALDSMDRALSEKTEGRWVTLIGKQVKGSRKIERYWVAGNASGTPTLPEWMAKVIRESSGTKEHTDGWLVDVRKQGDPLYEMIFTEPLKPFPQLIIAGAGHIGKALAHLGSLLDFEVTVIDDRPEYADPSLLPDADHVVVKEIGEAFGDLHPDADTYCVIVTRGHRQDGEALKPLIGSGAAYVGMIGSRHKVAVMKKAFIGNGWATPEQWDKIHAPIGLSIGSKTVNEIAVSIAAELIQVRNKQQQHGS